MRKFFTVTGHHTFYGETSTIIDEKAYPTKKDAAQAVADIANETLTEIAFDDDDFKEVKASKCMKGYFHDIHGDKLDIEIVEHELPGSPKEPPSEKWAVVCSSFDGWESKLYQYMTVCESKDKAIDFILNDYEEETEGHHVPKLRINRRKAKDGDQFDTPDMENKYNSWMLKKL